MLIVVEAAGNGGLHYILNIFNIKITHTRQYRFALAVIGATQKG